MNTFDVYKTAKAPLPLGTYSQGVGLGNLVFLAAQTPVVPETGEVVDGGFEEQLRQTFDNLKAMVEDGCNSSLSRVAQINVYITDVSKFSVMNDIMKEYFKEPFPARTTVGAKDLARGTLVAIDGILVL